MNHNDSICNADFYKDTGFNVIIDWLKENCLCPLNREFFAHLTPSINLQNISDIQIYSDELLSAFHRKDPLPLETVPDISNWIDSLDIIGFQLTTENFRELYQILQLSSKIKKFLTRKDFPNWYISGNNLFNSKKSIGKIESIFDDSFQIKNDASSELKKLIRSLYKAEGSIKDTMQKVFLRAKEENWLGGDQIVFRNGRSVLPLKISQKRKVKGIIQDQSATGQTAFVEPLEIIELNNRLTELQFLIIEEKQRILRELTAYFNPFFNQIVETFNILKCIDQHYTMAKLTNELEAVCPKLNNKGPLKLEMAVNPLFTLSGKEVVPLNIELNEEKTLLLSGPNAGGKTVVLKSIGLYTLMAQCGLFIPAKVAQLPIYTQFLADIGDRQSMENDLSTFSAHIQNLAMIVKRANKNTLVLLDELGTGTDPDAGAALSRAILESLLKNGSTVLATTHLGSLKVWAVNEEGIINGGMVFDAKALAPTYELQLGTPGASYALEISTRMGLNKNIINRSKEIIGDGSVNLENILSKLEEEQLAAESLSTELKSREKKLRQVEDQIFTKEIEINKAHKRAKSNALTEAEKIILDARREAENLISDIRANQADTQTIKKVKNQIDESLEKLHNKEDLKMTEFNTLDPSEIKKGDNVFVPHLNNNGKIIHLPDKKNRVRVEVNGITLTLKLNELQLIEPSKELKITHPSNISINKTSSIEKMQLDLRGKRVDEALHETEKHLDSALLAGMGFIQILHGKGTGALKEAIHEFLTEQTFVSKFYLANEDQGGAGITIVEF